MDFERFVVGKQAKVAPSNKTNKTANKRGLECSGPIGAPQEERQSHRLPRGQLRFAVLAEVGPKESMPKFDPPSLGLGASLGSPKGL